MNFSIPNPDAPRRLQDVTRVEGYAARALEIIQQIPTAEDDAAAVELLHRAKYALGAEQAAFASFIRDGDLKESFRFLVACDPVWCVEYQKHGWYSHDAWLLYAEANSEPICASQIPLRTPSQRNVRLLAAQYGIASAYIVPAPSGGGLSRLGVLMLASGHEGYFETGATASLKVLARSLAMDLHEWWVQKVRKEIIEKNRITPDDLQLLSFEREGLSTKRIARRLNTTTSAVDSRFQRLNAKLNMPSRRATARLAAEYGVI